MFLSVLDSFFDLVSVQLEDCFDTLSLFLFPESEENKLLDKLTEELSFPANQVQELSSRRAENTQKDILGEEKQKALRRSEEEVANVPVN